MIHEEGGVVKLKNLMVVLIIGFIAFIPVKAQTKSLRFAVLSDVHYAVDGKDRGTKMLASGKKLLPSVLKGLSNNEDIDFVVFTGDIFVDPYYPELKEFLKVVRTNLTKQWYVIPGNHDRAMNKDSGKEVFSLQEFVDVFSNHPYKKGGKNSYWSMDVDDYHLIGLDTTRADTWGGGISEKQMKWLAKDLKRNKERFTIIFTHHPIIEFHAEFDFSKEFFIENNQALLDLIFNNPQVKFVVSGHNHFSAVIFRDGIHHFSTPSIITYPGKYATFTVDKDNVAFRTVEVGNQAFKRRAMEGIVQQAFWRKKFRSVDHMLDVFRGLSAYTFEPRSN